MKKILTVAFLALSFAMFGQSGLRLVEEDAEPVIAQMKFCIPIVEIKDSLVILRCDGIRMEMPIEKLTGQLTIVIHPNDKDGAMTYMETVEWYITPKSEYTDSTYIEKYVK